MAAFGQLLFTLALYGLGISVLALSGWPAVYVFLRVWEQSAVCPPALKALLLSLAAAAGYFLFGFCLLLGVGLLRVVLGLRLAEGEHPALSAGSARWATANGLNLIVTIAFMDFILLTPFAPMLFRFLGAKVGRNVQINSKFCADLSLLEIGDNAVIGGHATVICHSFERHRLILKKVRIGRGAIIGLNAIILPGAQIGDGATVAAGAVVPKDSRVAPGTVYRGV